MSEILSRKDAKIRSLIVQAKKGKKMNEIASKLIAERAEAGELLNELRDVVVQFERELEDLHAEGQQTAQLQTQVAILTRALAVMEEEGCARCAVGKAWEETAHEELGEREEAMDAEARALKKELARERERNDELVSEQEWMRGEYARWESAFEISKDAESKGSARLSEMDALNSELVAEIAQLKSVLKLHERQIEALNEEEQEAVVLRSNVKELDGEIKCLARSLQAESESNANLMARLSRTELALSVANEKACKKDYKKEWEEAIKEIEDMRQKNQSIRHKLGDQEGEVSQTHLKCNMLESELERVKQNLVHALKNSDVVAEKLVAVTREKDKIKSLLATDTMNRLGRFLQ